ncbi:MAG: diguanylate cyclase [Candidatus Sulfotelmatobacter sp.]|jgi:GGDEF domain-containing protein
MLERRVDHITRKRVSQMSAEEMRGMLLTSEKTGLPNRRAFDEAGDTSFVAMADVNGLKGLNDSFGYSAGDELIYRFGQTLIEVGLDAYHEKGDEFLCRGESYEDLRHKLSRAQYLMRTRSFVVRGLDGSYTTVAGADFCFGIATTQPEAEKALKCEKRNKGCKRGALPSFVQRTPAFPHEPGFEIFLTDGSLSSQTLVVEAF